MASRLLNESVGETNPSSLDAPEIASHLESLRNVASLNTIALHASNIRAWAKKLRPGSEKKNSGPVAATAFDVP